MLGKVSLQMDVAFYQVISLPQASGKNICHFTWFSTHCSDQHCHFSEGSPQWITFVGCRDFLHPQRHSIQVHPSSLQPLWVSETWRRLCSEVGDAVLSGYEWDSGLLRRAEAFTNMTELKLIRDS
jgi:hypothetical protein